MSAALPVLEPLCRATEQVLKPLQLETTDYLFVSLNDKGHFVCQALAYRFASVNDNGETKLINGQKMILCDYGASWSATHSWQRRIPERKEWGNFDCHG